MHNFIKHVNQLRLKNNWYMYTGEVCGKSVKIKGFGTWLQIFEVNGINHSNSMECAVARFKQDLQDGIEYDMG